MRISDILGMGLTNLWRRKTRTILTILGVIIGTTSIVVMLSLGIGLKAATMAEVSSSGTLTQITVYTDYYDSGSNSNSGGRNLLLDEDTKAMFEGMDHVDSVDPRLEYDMPIQVGKYESYCMIYGVSDAYLQEITLAKGTIPSGKPATMELVAGNQVMGDFFEWATGTYPYYDTGEYPDVDLISSNVVAGLNISDDSEDSSDNQDSSTEEIFDPTFSADSTTSSNPDAVPQDNISDDSADFGEGDIMDENATTFTNFNANTKRVPIKIVGVTEGDSSTYTNYSYNYFTTIDQLKKFLQDNYSENQVIPGQPTDANGKPYRDLKYSNMVVNVDDAENVDSVMQEIQDMGYRAEANKEWLEEVEKQFMIIEAVLGGIGGVAMLVAAISIANTMTMSTYERTKEIGVMKVLGCSLNNIREMFLTEAAFIGLLGGIIGVGLSFALSLVVNRVAPAVMSLDLPKGSSISEIPFWLVLLAIIFSTVIGMLAGFFPAQRATKLSPLNAIRNE